MNYFLTILIALNVFCTYGQQCLKCRDTFDTLIDVSNQAEISNSEIEKAFLTTKELYGKRYVDRIDSIKNNTGFVSASLTEVFGMICLNRCDSVGVHYYLKYLELTDGSAEEERSFALERIFINCPEVYLNYVGQAYNEELAWGFLNNRGFINSKKEQINIHKSNYKQAFFQNYPSLKNTEKYSHKVELVLNQIETMIE